MESNCRLRKDHAGIALLAELHEEARTNNLQLQLKSPTARRPIAFRPGGLLRLPDLQALRDEGDQIVDATLRPARRSAAAMGAQVSRAACAGVGAMGARAGRSSVARDPAGSWSSSFSFATEHVGMSRGLPDAVGWEAL